MKSWPATALAPRAGSRVDSAALSAVLHEGCLGYFGYPEMVDLLTILLGGSSHLVSGL
jgi:hypothetical protein